MILDGLPASPAPPRCLSHPSLSTFDFLLKPPTQHKNLTPIFIIFSAPIPVGSVRYDFGYRLSVSVTLVIGVNRETTESLIYVVLSLLRYIDYVACGKCDSWLHELSYYLYAAFTMEREELVETNEASPRVVGEVEGDSFTVENEEDWDKHSVGLETRNFDHDGPEFCNEQDDILDSVSSQAVEKLEGDAFTVQSEDHDKESMEAEIQNIGHDGPGLDNEEEIGSDKIDEVIEVELSTHEETKDNVTGESQLAQRVCDSCDLQCGSQQENLETSTVPGDLFQKEHESDSTESEIEVSIVGEECSGVKVDSSGDFEPQSQEVSLGNNFGHHGLAIEEDDSRSMESAHMNQKTENTSEDSNLEPEVAGSDVPNTEVGCSPSIHTVDTNPEAPRVVEKVISLRDFVREKSIIAVSIMLRHLSGKRDECAVGNSDDVGKDASDLSKDSETKEVSEKTGEKTIWNRLMSSDVDAENKTVQSEEPIIEGPPLPIAMKGRVVVYTRLGCQECKEVRKFLYMKRLRYVEINIDVYPSRKMELEKNSRSTSVPKVFFNGILIGGLSTLKSLDESGKLNEKIDYLINEAPSFECPVPPLSGEDDVSSSGALDEMALIVRKMKECIVVKDRFCKMRRFTNCFVAFEAVDFLSEDQYLERKEAVEFARKLASKLFFQHVLDENIFEDGNHLYRFLDDDPTVASLCYNIPRGIITVKPKRMTEVASRLRLLSYAMFEAYASEDGRHVDYRSMHGSEEFARYLRIVEELQRGEIWDLSREEKLAFFINLYNMMTIHAILVWGHPSGALERRKLFGEFKYVIGGSTYSLSAIQNGILRANQRPPYTLMKPFSAKDKCLRVALPFPEPLIHFALVYGTRSGPALRCYSPGDIDKEIMDAARNFLRNGGLLIDYSAKVAYANFSLLILRFSVDFGKNEVEVLKHVSNYLDPAESALLLDLLATSELKVIYQPYDWGLNC
ncbi:grx, partial [Mucuna pruriens]